MPNPGSNTAHKAPQIFFVESSSDGLRRQVQVLQRDSKSNQCYVHYVNQDKRLDQWLPEDDLLLNDTPSTAVPASANKKKRKRGRSKRVHSEAPSTGESSSSVPTPPLSAESQSEVVPIAEESEPPSRTAKVTNIRKNFDHVFFGEWKIQTWYFSPYPLADTEIEDVPPRSTLARSYKPPGTARTAAQRANGRTTELLSGGSSRQQGPELPSLCVCDRCFKYFSEFVVWDVHQKACTKTPPGRKVYVRDPLSIWEIDGATQKLYCQNLSLFGKLFIDIKTLFFDLDNFMFYVLTTSTHSREFVIGYFSKEKVSFDDYNLACIVTFPHHQRQGFGVLMIEFSYELSRRAGKVGTPERPLSDLGLRGYLSYWVATIIRFFKRVLNVLPPKAKGIILNKNNFPDLTMVRPEIPGGRRRADPLTVDVPSALDFLDDPIFTTERQFETKRRLDGGAETHVHIACTIEDIARATNLRVDDTAFALNECGLMMKRFSDESATEPGAIIITTEMIDHVAEQRKVVLRTLLDLDCVQL